MYKTCLLFPTLQGIFLESVSFMLTIDKTFEMFSYFSYDVYLFKSLNNISQPIYELL